MALTVVTYLSPSGNNPVSDFVRDLTEEEQACYFAMVRDIQVNGLSMVTVRSIKGKLWEMKPDQNRYFYVLYTVTPENFLCILHAYKKESQRAPQHEIRTAEARMVDFLKRIEPAQRAAKEKAEKGKGKK